MKEDNERNAAVTPSGSKGDDPGAAGPGTAGADSATNENQGGHVNPSAPEDANTTPGTTGDK